MMKNIDRMIEETLRSDEDIEAEIKRKRLDAPRITLDSIKAKIKGVEFVRHDMASGSILRWCVIELQNGFAVTGEPSVAVSIENDDCEIGQTVAFKNAFNRIWALEGYLLKDRLASQAKTGE